MKELFDKFLMYFCFAGIGAIAVVAFVRVTLPAAVREARSAARKAKKSGPAVIIPVLCVAGLIVYGSTKNNSPTNDSPAQQQMASQSSIRGELQVEKIVADALGARPLQSAGVASTQSLELNEAQPTNSLVRVEKWWRRGAYNDGQILTFDEDWCFPYGTNHLTRIEVWASGAVYASMKAPSPIVELVTKLSVAPQDTEVYMGRTTNNTYRIEWHGGHPNRDANQIADASIELFRNGNVVVTEDGMQTEIPYDIPFEHDGFGQDDDWVRANFTNAEEIISIGYANWVDQQVGVNLKNGLYKFTALFEDDPPEPTQLYIGDYSVCVTNAGEYVFVLNKGEEYEFGTQPFNDDVDYWAQDDLGADAPTLTSWCGGQESPGKWTIDGGWNWFRRPSFSYGQYYNGCCAWGPTFKGSPDVAHLKESDFPKRFSAVVSDYPDLDNLRCEWRSSEKNIRIISPHSKETLIAVDSMLSWDCFDLSVSTEIKGRSYTSSIKMGYGTNETPVASLDLSAPKVVFVNDDNRTSRWYRVTAKLSSPTPTNAVLSISHSGGAQILYATDPEGMNRFTMTDVNLVVDSPVSSTRYAFYFAATNNNCIGKFTATCTLADSTALDVNREYKVIEPLRKLVCNDQVAGAYYNPSRLVYGTNAWLKVGVNGQFNASDVQWRVVSGPGRIASRNDSDWAVSVEPTAPFGEVVVEAAFGNDSVIQPRFVLPIVQKRRVPVSGCVVLNSTGNPAVTQQKIEANLRRTNQIYSQAGVEFYFAEAIAYLNEPSFSILSEHNLVTNSAGRVSTWGVCPQVTNLLDRVDGLSSNATIKLVWVSRIVNGTPLAFTMSSQRSCLFSANPRASDTVMAHEIGHAMGLKDVYDSRKKVSSDHLVGGGNPVDSHVFEDLPYDWGSSDGRGFNEVTDTHSDIIRKCLMHGRDTGGSDIPYSKVEGFSSTSLHVFDTSKVSVGASNMRND